ncbi:SCO family protein [Chryseosolibacter indicus]|uniref:SCO family protein n=1 Tax=Chryseosolibacter indicus TaxID=2782351 RepID=A0ABS5VPX7_9BACT|nr:SCO family protein [Chryseosolibacter indicus]MBT1702076.1 SCO family protein [Chryseosolibacter indicus]
MNRSKITNAIALFLALCFLFGACIRKKEQNLPILGERNVEGSDTVYHTIADFRFVDQDSQIVTNETFKDKIYVADFFFTSCRTICPIMKTQMLRVYDSIENDPEILILSHTIDPEYDTVGKLKDFAERLGVKSSKWHFVTGKKDSIYNIAQTSYFATAMEDKAEPDGFIHSGAFLLIDKERRIRGKYDGTKEEDVNRLMADLERLKNEYKRESK